MDQVFHAPLVLTMDPSVGEGPLGAIRDGAVGVRDGRVCFVGERSQEPEGTACEGVLMPALVDAHTHAVWAGSRADEFLRRLEGVPYVEILEAGGGILSTVRATRGADEATLAAWCADRLRRLAARGVGTVEVKSGYGLSPEHEAKLLRAARTGGELAGVRVLTTFLGAHAVPAEWRGDREGYVDQVVSEQLPLCAPLADFVDVYVDRGAFTVEEGRRILAAGRDAGLGVRVHAEQVAYTGAAEMAAKLGALSADHLERIDEAGVAAMAEAGTIAGMLPGAMLYLHDPSPPVAMMREAGVRFFVATDLNPGSSPVADLFTCASLAAVTMGLTVDEVLLGITAVAADALGRSDLGRIREGGPAELIEVALPPGEPASAAALVQFLGAGFGRVRRLGRSA
jgi:imidazolonepropionase